ncbi:hypothetical protein BH09BAC6_BH09BAC6_05740 [soil metagenome]|jgi:hypothetical protein
MDLVLSYVKQPDLTAKFRKLFTRPRTIKRKPSSIEI